MAFTVTVIDRDELETMAGRACDNGDTGTCACLGPAAEAQVDDTVTVQLSPLED